MAKKKKSVLGLSTTAVGTAGAASGLIKGGSIGVAAFGGAVSLPLWVALGAAGVTAGAIGAGAYLGYKKIRKKSKKRKS